MNLGHEITQMNTKEILIEELNFVFFRVISWLRYLPRPGLE